MNSLNQDYPITKKQLMRSTNMKKSSLKNKKDLEIKKSTTDTAVRSKKHDLVLKIYSRSIKAIIDLEP